ncbi:MAG: hypothetical protein ABII00_08645 [Elusimicrobiota bacterium]
MIHKLLATILAASLPSMALAEPRMPDIPSVTSVLETIGIQGDELDVDMDIHGWSDGDYNIRDSFLNIDIDVDRESDGETWRFGGDVDGRGLRGEVEKKSDDSYEIWGGGLNVDMRRRGTDNWEISGFVDEVNGSNHIDITLRQRGGPGCYDVWEHGVDLDVNRWASSTSLRGDIEVEKFGKNALALTAIFIAVLQSELDTQQSKP